MERIPLLPVLAATTACSGAGPASAPGPDSCPVGDLSSPVEIELVVRAADGSVSPVAPMGNVPLVEPPQGGQVLFVGVQARNLDACSLTLQGRLVDPASGAVLGEDTRIVDLAAGADGWAAPPEGAPIGSFSNVPVCPNPSAPREIDGASWLLEVTVTDQEQRTGSLSTTVTPVCADTLCSAECRLQ